MLQGNPVWSKEIRKYTKNSSCSWGDEGRERFHTLVEQEKKHRKEYDDLIKNKEDDIEYVDCFNYDAGEDSASASDSDDSEQDEFQWAAPIAV